MSKQTTPANSKDSNLVQRWTNSIQQGFGWVRYAVFAAVLICLAFTIVTTWSVWQVRQTPPNLPIFEAVQPFNYQWLLMGSLVVALLAPRIGCLALIAVLGVSMLGDLIRCQPQMFAMPILLIGCAWQRFQKISVWFLISMWIWTGVHKILSPHWFGPVMNEFGQYFGWSPETTALIAWLVPIAEITVGVMAILVPRLAAVACVALHLGIVATLLALNWNFSVLYWNCATAIAGCYMLWTVGQPNQSAEPDDQPRRSTRFASWPTETWAVVTAFVLLAYPAAVYANTVPHFLAHVLYSDNMPRAVISTDSDEKLINTWGELNVPIPHTEVVYTKYLWYAGQSGDKLHMFNPRGSSKYFLRSDRSLRELSLSEFLDPAIGTVTGKRVDVPMTVFRMSQASVQMKKRQPDSTIFAVTIPANSYSPELLSQLSGLHNIEQIQLAGCPVTDEDLKRLPSLSLLVGIGLNDTNVSQAGIDLLRNKANFPAMQVVEYQGTALSLE